MECDDSNDRSCRVAGRCGMVKEGHVRENKRGPDGTLSGTLHFGLLKREFKALERGAAWHRGTSDGSEAHHAVRVDHREVHKTRDIRMNLSPESPITRAVLG